MYKTLLKKQLLEMNAFYFIDRKTEKRRSKGKATAFISLFAFCFLAISFAFFGVSDALYGVLKASNYIWSYYAIMGLMAIFIGTFGSVFNTYAGLFKSTDNDLMLSLPVKPVAIIVTRMLGVYFMSLLYSFIIWLPTIVRRFINPPISISEIIILVLMIFVIPFVVTILTCVLGWIVALISSRIKNKTLVSTLLYVVIFGVYYYVNFKSRELIAKMINNVDKISASVKTWVYPMYIFGKACSGNLSSFIIFILLVAVLFTIFMFIMSKTFFKIIASGKTNSKSKKSEIKINKSSIKKSLLIKDFKRFTTSTTYFLNGGLGVFLIIGFSIFAIIKKEMIIYYTSFVATYFGVDIKCLLIFVAGMIGMFLSMDCITTPSISLEAKNLWILKSTPLNIKDILDSKINLSVLFNSIGAVVSSILLSITVNSGVVGFILILLYSISVIYMSATIGLVLGLKHPVLSWTNETVPVKQSLSVMFCVFGGMIFNLLFVGIYIFTKASIMAEYYIAIFVLIQILVSIIMKYWLNTRGIEVFEEL